MGWRRLGRGRKNRGRERQWPPDSKPVRGFEPTDQFTFLGVDADDGSVFLSEAPALALKVVELAVALGARCAEALAVGMQGVSEFYQQSADGVETNPQAQSTQQPADLAQTQSGPRAPPSHGIAGLIRGEQLAQRVQELGRFFPRACARRRLAGPDRGEPHQRAAPGGPVRQSPRPVPAARPFVGPRHGPAAGFPVRRRAGVVAR